MAVRPVAITLILMCLTRCLGRQVLPPGITLEFLKRWPSRVGSPEEWFVWQKCLKLLSPEVKAHEDSQVWFDNNGEFVLAYISSHPNPEWKESSPPLVKKRLNDNIPV